MVIKDNDFVKIEFTGTIKETGKVFDTTSKEVAQNYKLDPKAKYGPATICIGRGHIFKKIESAIKNSEVGKKFKLELEAEEAFGKKHAKLIHTMPTSVFRKEKINPVVGLNVTVNDKWGVIRTVNGGRCMVDFNHPLSGKALIYDVKILGKVEDDREKVSHIIITELMIDNFTLVEKEGIMNVTFHEKIAKLLTDEMRKVLINKIKEITGIVVKIK